MNLRLIFVVLATFLLGSCSRGVQNGEAVRQGVINYLSQRSDLNVSQLDVNVSSVSFRQDEADATVSIRPKGTPAAQGMEIRYTLERQGNRWVVKGKGKGQEAHSAVQPAPGQLPPGHPSVGDRSKAPEQGAPPPGHASAQGQGSAKK